MLSAPWHKPYQVSNRTRPLSAGHTIVNKDNHCNKLLLTFFPLSSRVIDQLDEDSLWANTQGDVDLDHEEHDSED